jgi:serine/threonine protein kinase/tetratricopeptide (TPR) repeat protein
MTCPSCHAQNPADQSFCGSCGAKLHATPPPSDLLPTRGVDREELATGSAVAGRYQVIEELGHGGMGRVYKVFDSDLKERIALKVLRPDLAADREAVERFSQELKLARRIAHRNVCRLYDLGRADALSFLTMEYVPGEDLRRLMRKVGVLRPGQAVRIARQLCDGLTEAHRLGVVHRDLKPQNVMVDEDGNAKIMDFGVACLASGQRLTGPGVIVGTPQYMSPEQVDGADVDPRSDIYALGVILYEMTTGRVPFDGDTPLSVAHKQKYETPPDPRTINADLPPDLAALILKCLGKDKNARYASAAEMALDLDGIGRALPTTDPVAATRRTTSTQITIPFGPRPLIAVGVAAILVVAAGLFVWRPWSPRVPISPRSGKPRVAVTWFDNQSERPDLDRVVVNLLTTNLTRDDSIDVVSDQGILNALRKVGGGDTKVVARTTASAVAAAAEAGLMVTGSIAKLGDRVRVSAELVNVATGRALASFQEDGQKIDDVIPMVDRLTSQIRTRLVASGGASGPELKVADVSTTSLDAYTHFQRGTDLLAEWKYESGIKELEQAVAIDPGFAAAWVALAQATVGFSYGESPFDEGAAGQKVLDRAKRVAARATERERLWIDLMQASLDQDLPGLVRRADGLVARYPEDFFGNLYAIGGRMATGDAPGGVSAAERYLEVNPSDANAYNMLAYLRSMLQDHGAAVSAIKKYLALHPDGSNPYDSAWEIYTRAGQFDEAIAITDRWRTVRPEDYDPRRYAAWTFVMRGDAERARQELQAAPGGSPVTQARDIAMAYMAEGRFREAEAAYRRAVAIAEGIRKKADESSTTGIAGLRDAHFDLSRMLTVQGKAPEAVREADAGVEAFSGEIGGQAESQVILGRYLAGMALLRAGDLLGASRKADEIGALAKRFKFTSRLLAYRSALVAEVAASRKDARTLAEMFAASPKDLWAGDAPPLLWHPFLVHATMSGDAAEAVKAVEGLPLRVQRARYWPGTPFAFFYERSRAPYVLGQMYEIQGDAARARESYTRFLTLMAKADAGIPEVEEARKRLVAITGR